MFTKKRAFALILSILCLVMSFSVLAEEPVSAYAEFVIANTEAEEPLADLDYALMYISNEYVVKAAEKDPAFEENYKAALAVIVADYETYEKQSADRNAADYLEWADAKATAGENSDNAADILEALEKGETTVAEIAEEAKAALAEEADAEKLETAYSYIDGYADAIQVDSNNKANISDAKKEVRNQDVKFYATILSIVPALIAIVLALITKEVYSSLFIGIVSGGIIYAIGPSGFSFETALTHVVSDGFVSSLADSYNVGILLFLVLLGTLVAMMNKAGGSAAFGRWAAKHIKTRTGAQLATIALGVLIFVDDYFNCLTVGSVMRPVCDAKKISRAKLSYLIDATAAPVCIIAPISSWAAAVAGFAPEGQGIGLFIKAIPFNFYALLTIVMMITIAFMKFDYGPMALHEKNAEEKGDIFTTLEETSAVADEKANEKGKVIDLVLPVVILIICCIIGMVYSGGFFDADSDGYRNFVSSFSNCDASVGLALGSVVSVILVAIYFLVFRHGVIKFSSLMECVPEGFKAMVPAILILTMAWTLKVMTDSLGATVFIAEFVNNNAGAFMNFLPAIIFLIAVGLSFATGTSWGTFGILIPIVLAVFANDSTMSIVGMSACMAGAVCGDHCSPISDTTIMSSAGAQCVHVNHVNTQLPYAFTVAGVSFVAYIFAGFVPNAWIALPVAIVLMLGTLFVLKAIVGKKNTQ